MKSKPKFRVLASERGWSFYSDNFNYEGTIFYNRSKSSSCKTFLKHTPQLK